MIKIEEYMTRKDGTVLMRTYSDQGFKIEREDGQIFDEAIDPLGSGRLYFETDIPIETEDDFE